MDKILIFVILVNIVIKDSNGHTWMSCPLSFAPFPNRAGHTSSLCENDGASGATRDDFCFFLNGTRGHVNSNIRDIPGNAEYDLRVTNEQSAKQEKCRDKSPTMNLISDATDPKQPYRKVPPLTPTCNDNIQSQDDESVVCMGKVCSNKAYPIRPSSAGDYFKSLQQTGSIWDRGGIINLEITITKDITERQCWQMIIQFTCPVSVRGTWNDVKLVNKSKNIVILEQDDGFFKPLEAGQKRYASLEILNPCYDSQDSQCIDCGNWYKELMQFNRFELDVKEAMKCTTPRSTPSPL